ncbi:restriction endonuclease subunit S [Microbulbifer sp. VAAF005]|uniref:restriction endonuclease subunit S n=1 Tax=Microbulbifer sp. VAAF005 TaxID=3034230 RepID=UPI0024ADF0A8|nr:restriction endonuclease subunit S [Microbulbifer sp. VAAF005]WHI45596.1 restriction endonuclease subunit S [Microbulbifer sp. VAAF005]
MSQAPISWISFTLKEVTQLQGGKTPAKSNPLYWNDGDIFWASPKDMKVAILNDTFDKISSLALSEGGKLYPKNSILFVVRSGILKHSFPIAVSNIELTVNQDLKVIEPHEHIHGSYLAYTLRAFSQVILSNCSKSGTTVNSIEIPKLENLQLPLAPLAEQKVITGKLDRLLVQVESSKARLQRIPQILKRFRQAVLAAAVSGSLTKNWAAEVKTIGEVCLSAFDGPFGSKLKTADYTDDGVRVARLENIGNLSFDDSKKTFISEEKFKTLTKNKLNVGDVLFSSFVDEEVRVCVFNIENDLYINKADCFCLRPNSEKVNSSYLAYILASSSSYTQIKQQVQGVTRPRINLKILKSLSFNFPPYQQQLEVVHQVEHLFAYADKIEQQVNSALAKVEQLSQSILAKAFRGELTEQWRRDNPDLISGDNSAAALLERIQAERAATKAAPRKRRKTTAA